MSESADKEIERLRWQCRRGLLELDCIFEDYLEQRYTSASEEEQRLFKDMLNQLDPDLQAWILLDAEPPTAELKKMVGILRGDT